VSHGSGSLRLLSDFPHLPGWVRLGTHGSSRCLCRSAVAACQAAIACAATHLVAGLAHHQRLQSVLHCMPHLGVCCHPGVGKQHRLQLVAAVSGAAAAGAASHRPSAACSSATGQSLHEQALRLPMSPAVVASGRARAEGQDRLSYPYSDPAQQHRLVANQQPVQMVSHCHRLHFVPQLGRRGRRQWETRFSISWPAAAATRALLAIRTAAAAAGGGRSSLAGTELGAAGHAGGRCAGAACCQKQLAQGACSCLVRPPHWGLLRAAEGTGFEGAAFGAPPTWLAPSSPEVGDTGGASD
jgi:hypothetical protein